MNGDRAKRLSKRCFFAAVVYMVLIFAISQVPGSVFMRLGFNIWDKAAHAIVYAPLAALLMGWAVLRARGVGSASILRAVALAVAITLAYGLLDELHQAFVPGRTPSVGDAAADLVGGIVGAAAAAALFLWRSRRASWCSSGCSSGCQSG
jgi:hypothetical protein